MRDDRGHYIQTVNGRFWLEDPRPEEIRLEDIARALSNTCRYCGHGKFFFSVAQHSVLVSYMCEEKDALWGLMHDGAEAYIGDLTTPLKKVIGQKIFDIEEKIFDAVRIRFDLTPATMPASVKWADRAIVIPECQALFGIDPVEDWGYPVGDKPHHNNYQPNISYMSPKQAAELFLLRFRELTDSIP